MFKSFSKGSSAGSSKAMQLLANYHLKERGPYMSAEELLKTQYEEDKINDKGQFMGLQKTDIIQINTEAFDHWAMYIGNDCVAHLKDGFVREALLVDVANGKKCRINNKLKSAEKREFKALLPATILQVLEGEINKAVPQNALHYNSEHQVTKWKFGEAFSDTVDKLLIDGGRAIGTGVGASVGVLLTGPAGLAAGPFGYKIGEKVTQGAIDLLNKNNSA